MAEKQASKFYSFLFLIILYGIFLGGFFLIYSNYFLPRQWCDKDNNIYTAHAIANPFPLKITKESNESAIQTYLQILSLKLSELNLNEINLTDETISIDNIETKTII